MKLLIIILHLLGPFIVQHNGQWHDNEIQVTTSSEEAKSLYIHARDLSENMDFGNAILLINKALKIDSGFALAYLLKARQTTNSEDQEFNLHKAEHFSEGISNGEKYLILYYIAVFRSDPEMQAKYLKKLTDYFPGDKRVQFIVASDKYLSGDYKVALEHLITLIKIDPFYYPAYNLIGYCKAGMDEQKERDKLPKHFFTVLPQAPWVNIICS